jgi:hypothetical protein
MTGIASVMAVNDIEVRASQALGILPRPSRMRLAGLAIIGFGIVLSTTARVRYVDVG